MPTGVCDDSMFLCLFLTQTHNSGGGVDDSLWGQDDASAVPHKHGTATKCHVVQQLNAMWIAKIRQMLSLFDDAEVP